MRTINLLKALLHRPFKHIKKKYNYSCKKMEVLNEK